MEIICIKSINGRRYSIIKEGENIIVNNSKIIQFDSIRKILASEHTSHLNKEKPKDTSDLNAKIDENITNYFFNAIHKNYLANKKR